MKAPWRADPRHDALWKSVLYFETAKLHAGDHSGARLMRHAEI